MFVCFGGGHSQHTDGLCNAQEVRYRAQVADSILFVPEGGLETVKQKNGFLRTDGQMRRASDILIRPLGHMAW